MFTKDIISSLPYVEVVSEQTFEVTDVMMDDCRMLLLKVSPPLLCLFPCSELELNPFSLSARTGALLTPVHTVLAPAIHFYLQPLRLFLMCHRPH